MIFDTIRNLLILARFENLETIKTFRKFLLFFYIIESN